MSMYSQFHTDASMERNGIELDYGEFIVTIARAGGSNNKFTKVLENKTKPYRRAIQTESMDRARGEAVLVEVYAEAVILDWKVRVGEDLGQKTKYKTGIEAEDGSVLPYTTKNVVETLTALPDLFLDIQEQAGKVALFRKDLQEVDSKN